jgi:hypothetical protein
MESPVKNIIALLLVLFCVAPAAVMASRYDAHLGNVVGSARMLGLAGASRAEGESFESSFFNPAGLSWMKGHWDGDLSFGFFNQSFKSRDTFLDVSDDSFFFVQAGVSHRFVRWPQWAVGLGLQVPYGFSLSGSGNSDFDELNRVNFSFEYSTLSLPVSYQVKENLSVGLSLRSSLATMRFSSFSQDSTAENPKSTESVFGVGFDLGAIYQYSSRQRFGLTYHYGESLNFDEQANIDVLGFDPYREAKRPHQIFLGSSYQWSPRLESFHDLGIVFGMGDAVVPGSGMSSSLPAISSGQSISVSYHLGVEYDLLPKRLQVRAGHYYQPARSDLDPQRFHVTVGATYQVWLLHFAGAFDWAKDYHHLSLSAGPSLNWGGASARR